MLHSTSLSVWDQSLWLRWVGPALPSSKTHVGLSHPKVPEETFFCASLAQPLLLLTLGAVKTYLGSPRTSPGCVWCSLHGDHPGTMTKLSGCCC
jgi:hypothetical protein